MGAGQKRVSRVSAITDPRYAQQKENRNKRYRCEEDLGRQLTEVVETKG
jgi:hypothetical protein